MGAITKSVFKTRKIAYSNFIEQIKLLNELTARGCILHNIDYAATPGVTDTRQWAEVYYEEFT